MRLNEVKAYEIMTPRVVAAIASEKMTLREYYDSDAYDHFSRIPVYADSPEFITGYVLRGDALEELTEDQFQKTLGEIKRSLLYFNEEMNVSDIFDAMLKEKSQIGVVIDEYGCLQGIITFEDVIETIFGLEIIDEMDVVTDMQQYARERWQLRQKRFKPVVMRSNEPATENETNTESN
jgi:CBS domain containing-hemolysin-like protein